MHTMHKNNKKPMTNDTEFVSVRLLVNKCRILFSDMEDEVKRMP